MNKVCTKCNESKPINQYYKAKTGLYGVRGDCKECVKQSMTQYRWENPEVVRSYNIKKKKWNENRDLENYNLWRKKYYTAKRKDPVVRMSDAIKSRMHVAFKKISHGKEYTTEELLGCSCHEAKLHIESLFTDGMSWDNYGKWHIDHIIPMALAKDAEDLKILCHFSNLQPLWAAENIRKKNKLIEKYILNATR